MATRPSDDISWVKLLSRASLSQLALQAVPNKEHQTVGYRLVFPSGDDRVKSKDLRFTTPPLHVQSSIIALGGSLFRTDMADVSKRWQTIKTSRNFSNNPEFIQRFPGISKANDSYYSAVGRLLERIKELLLNEDRIVLKFVKAPIKAKYGKEFVGLDTKQAGSKMFQLIKKHKDDFDIRKEIRTKFEESFTSWIFAGNDEYEGDAEPGMVHRYKYQPFNKFGRTAETTRALSFENATPIDDDPFIVRIAGHSQTQFFELIRKLKADGYSYSPVHFKVADENVEKHTLPDGSIVPWPDDPRINFLRQGSVIKLLVSLFIYCEPRYGVRMSFAPEIGVYERGPETTYSRIDMESEWVSTIGSYSSNEITQKKANSPKPVNIDLQQYTQKPALAKKIKEEEEQAEEEEESHVKKSRRLE